MATITDPIQEVELLPVLHDDRTGGPLALPLPHMDNSAKRDAQRIRASFILLATALSDAIGEADVRQIVGEAVAALVDSSPAALDTLNELAAAIGDNPNFAAEILAALGLRAPIASPSFTGTPRSVTPATTVSGTEIATAAYVRALLTAGATQGGAWTVPTAPVDDNDTSPASTAFVQRERLRGGTFTGSVSTTPGALEVLTGGTKAVSFTEGNRRRFELRSGANIFNVTDIPESGGDLELDLLYTAGTLGFTQTVNWSVGNAQKSTAIGDTGLTLTGGVRYAVCLWNMGGAYYGGIS